MNAGSSLLSDLAALDGRNDLPFQVAGQAVPIGSWSADDDFGIHPKGSQPKRVVVCPENSTYSFLIPGHSYIFKTAKKDWQAQQLWSEVVAYRVACLAHVQAPPCFAALDEYTGETGVLMEFFFGYPGEAVTPRLIHGGDVLVRLLADRKRGRPHGVRTNVMIGRRFRVAATEDWWGQALMFDALIANVDRHPDNWGYLFSFQGVPQIRMAPLYDNGTSLGYGITDHQLATKNVDDLLTRFVAKGLHHCGWDAADDERGPHVALCARYAAAYPGAIAAMRNVIRFDNDELREILDEMVKFDIAIPFTQGRANFIYALVTQRKLELAQIVGL